MTFKELFNRLDVIAVLGFLIAIETQITNGTMSFTHTLPPAWIEVVKEWAGNLASVGGLMVAFLRMSSNGPSSTTTTVAKILITAFLLSSFLAVSPLQAADKPVPTKTTTVAATKDPMSVLKTFVVNDIQAALDDATANSDQSAIDCWAAMLPAVQNAQNPLPTKLGAFLALQKARDAVRGVDMFKAGVGPLADLKNKCAAIVVDTNTFLIRLGVLSGGAAFGF